MKLEALSEPLRFALCNTTNFWAIPRMKPSKTEEPCHRNARTILNFEAFAGNNDFIS